MSELREGGVGRATMRDVAALSGTSIKTVSRVVNAEPGVSPALVARVRSAVERLGYQHNLQASNLRRAGGRTEAIGLLLEDVGNPYSSTLHRAIEDVARARGVIVLASSCDEDPGRERESIQAFTQRRVDGMILMPASHDQSYLLGELRAGTPIVMVDRAAAFLNVDDVVTDNRDGTARGVAHLIAHGHRRIAFLGDSATIWTAAERRAGYDHAHAVAGVPVDEALVRADLPTAEAAAAAVLALFDGPEPPTALFAARNLLAIGAVQALRRLGRQRSVALVGFDDFPLADLLEPAVTVIAQDPAEIGRVAARRLFARLDGDDGPPARTVVPSRLVARGSGRSGLRRPDDADVESRPATRGRARSRSGAGRTRARAGARAATST